jgi:hypothetical protein
VVCYFRSQNGTDYRCGDLGWTHGNSGGTGTFYGSLVKDAEKRRDVAEGIAADAIAKRQSIEEDFVKLKGFFESQMNRPIQAPGITDEQIDQIAKHIGAKLLPFTSRLGTPTQ